MSKLFSKKPSENAAEAETGNDQARKSSGIKASFSTKAFRIGGYSVVASLVVFAILVAVNFGASKIPEKYTKLDMTDQKLFTISEQTRNLLSGLDRDITIYWLVQSGKEDAAIDELLGRYADLGGSYVSVIKKDPVVYPSFAVQYTTASIYDNSLIVVCGDRSSFVSYYSIYLYDAANYQYTGTYDVTFDGEGALTSAINYVISEDLPKVYVLSGHGESSLGGTAESLIAKENLELVPLDLIGADTIPSDCKNLIICGPETDISENERDMILDYLKGGGTMTLLTDWTENELPNLMAVMAYYDVSLTDGIVVDPARDHSIVGSSSSLLPDIGEHAITKPIINAKYRLIFPLAQGIAIAPAHRYGLEVTPVATTSDSAFSKIAGYNMQTFEKEEGDIVEDAPYHVGVVITEPIDDKTETKIVWFSTSLILTDVFNNIVSQADYDLFINALDWMCALERNISIHAKNMNESVLSVSSGEGALLSLVMVGLIPLALIAAGIAVTVRRKRR